MFSAKTAFSRKKKIVESHEYRIKNFKVHVSPQANHSQFTNFHFIFSPFTKLKALNPVSPNNPFHLAPLQRKNDSRKKESSMCVHILSLVLKHFSVPHSNSCHLACVYKKKGFVKGETLRLPRTNSSKAMFEGNVRKFKTRLISRGCPKQKVGWKLSNKNWERTKRFYPLSHNFNRHCTKLEKHTYGQMAFNTKPAVAQRDIQGASLDLL